MGVGCKKGRCLGNCDGWGISYVTNASGESRKKRR